MNIGVNRKILAVLLVSQFLILKFILLAWLQEHLCVGLKKIDFTLVCSLHCISF